MSWIHEPAKIMTRSMLSRALVIWVVLLVIAVMNGGLRVAFLEPTMGQYAGHVASALILSALICLVAWLSVNWIRPHSARDAFVIGVDWLALTVAFEFLAGHYLFGDPWSSLLADYNLLQGRLWVLVLLVTLLSPAVAYRFHARSIWR
jgi:hypothetical protein